MLFEELLARAAEPTLQALVGRSTVSLLGKLDPRFTQPDKLREVLLGVRSPADILLDRAARSELLQLLPKHEAVLLAQRLGCLHDGADPYGVLSRVEVRKGSKRAAELLDFFSVDVEVDGGEDTRPSSFPLVPARPLFQHQAAAVRRVVGYLEAEPPRVLLHMPTGSGKTRTAMTVLAELLNRRQQGLAIWFAHSEELCEQAVEEFSASWSVLGTRPLTIYRWWGEHQPDVESARDGLIVAGLAKAYTSATRSVRPLGTIAGRVDLIVMDEAHQAVAPTYQLLLELLSQAGTPTPILGLSATPGRSWNNVSEDERLSDFFHRQKVTLQVDGYSNPIDYLVAEGYLARAAFESLYYESGTSLSAEDRRRLEDSLDIPASIIKRIAEDEQRNLLILNRVEGLLRAVDRLLVFAASVEHALVLSAALRARGTWAYAITGETPSTTRSRLISTYKNGDAEPRVLVNFGVLTTGFDAPRTAAAIIARPTKSLVLYSQMVGRAIRGPRAGGNETAHVATVVDTELPGFSSLAEAFLNWEDVW